MGRNLICHIWKWAVGNSSAAILLRAAGLFALMVIVFVRTVGVNPDLYPTVPLPHGSAPERAEFVFLTGSGPRLVDYRELEDVVTRHPEGTFLLPEDHIADLERELQRQKSDWPLSIRLLSDSGDRQRLEVGRVGDYANYIGYDATQRMATPLYTRGFFPDLHLETALMRSLGILLLGLLVEKVITSLGQRRRGRSSGKVENSQSIP